MIIGLRMLLRRRWPPWIRCSIPSNSGALAGNGRLQEGQSPVF